MMHCTRWLLAEASPAIPSQPMSPCHEFCRGGTTNAPVAFAGSPGMSTAGWQAMTDKSQSQKPAKWVKAQMRAYMNAGPAVATSRLLKAVHGWRQSCA